MRSYRGGWDAMLRGLEYCDLAILVPSDTLLFCVFDSVTG